MYQRIGKNPLGKKVAPKHFVGYAWNPGGYRWTGYGGTALKLYNKKVQAGLAGHHLFCRGCGEHTTVAAPKTNQGQSWTEPMTQWAATHSVHNCPGIPPHKPKGAKAKSPAAVETRRKRVEKLMRELRGQ